MHVIITLLASLAAVSAVPALPQRIVGGDVTTIDQYPSNAALQYSSDGNFFWLTCGGTIINNRAILSAAHCSFGDSPSRWRARVGSTWASGGGIVFTFGSIIIHPLYNGRSPKADIAIMRTTSIISPSDTIQPASIAGPNYIIGDNEVVWAAGWGSSSPLGGPNSEQLRHVQFWIAHHETCRARYADAGVDVTGMLCTGVLGVGGRGQCIGDDGGAVYHNGVVVGVSTVMLSCGSQLYPDVNVRVSSFVSWILANA